MQLRDLAADVPNDWPEAERCTQGARGDSSTTCAPSPRPDPPDTAIGEENLARLMGSAEALEVDLSDFVRRAKVESARLHQLMDESCSRNDPAASS